MDLRYRIILNFWKKKPSKILIEVDGFVRMRDYSI